MENFRFQPDGKIKELSCEIKEGNMLNVGVVLENREPFYLVFHDYIKKDGERYFLFHKKTIFKHEKGSLFIRTSAVKKENYTPIPGLVVTYRFDFDKFREAFYLSADYGCDMPLCDCEIKLMEISWIGMEEKTYTGYEYNAEGKNFIITERFPEKREAALDYEELLKTRGGEILEKVKVRPRGFKKALSVFGEKGGVTIFGNAPVLNIESRFIQCYPDIWDLKSDIRYYSGANSPGSWFVFEKQDDMFKLFSELEGRTPVFELKELPCKGEYYKVESGCIQTTIVRTCGGVWVSKEGAQPQPLCYLLLSDTKYNRKIQLDSANGWDNVNIKQKKNFLRISLNNPENGKITGISIVLEAEVEPEFNRISWQVKVINRTERYSVVNASYPQMIVTGFDTAYGTIGSGALMRNFNATHSVFGAKYPLGGKTSNAFTALYHEDGNGIYMGIHDSEGNFKSLFAAGVRQTDTTLLGAFCNAPYEGKPGNSFTLPGKAVFEGFRGDWYDAAMIYKHFVHTKANWFTKSRGRYDSPQWIREMPVWILHYLPSENPDSEPFPVTLRDKYPDKYEDDWYKTAIKFKQEIGVPVAYHIYNWHWVPFNNENPHYFPARHDFKDGVKELKKAGVKIVPYVSGYSWDRFDGRGQGYRFESEAYPYSVKNQKGDVVVNSHATKKPDGSPVQFARMCPATPFWKEEVRQLCRKLYTDYGMDGIYLDVVSAAFNSCFDENHLHPTGYGSWWWKAYSELLSGIYADAPEDFAIVSENVSEVYSSSMDGFLAWIWIQPDQVPGYPAIYGGRIATFGRVITSDKRDDDEYSRFQFAQGFMYGQQLGWIHPEIVNDENQFPYLKKLANLRYENAEFFASAEMLRPPVVEGDMHLIDTTPFLRGRYYNHEKSVMASGWEDAEGIRKLFVANSSSERAHVCIRINQKEYKLPKNFDFCDGSYIKIKKIQRYDGTVDIYAELEPQCIDVIKWKL